MEYKDLTEGQRVKIAACKTPEELVTLAREEGVELTDEQLEQVAGGWGGNPDCPECGSGDVVWDNHLSMFICRNCGYEFC